MRSVSEGKPAVLCVSCDLLSSVKSHYTGPLFSLYWVDLIKTDGSID